MFRKNSIKKKQSSEASSSSSPSTGGAAVPRLVFPTTRSRPSSMVDTAAFDASNEATLSSSPSSSIHSFGAGTSPSQKHSLSAMERLASTQKRDAAAAAAASAALSSRARTRTSSNTSRSSLKHDGSEGSHSRSSPVPSLMKSAAAYSPAKPSTSTDLSAVEDTSSATTGVAQTTNNTEDGNQSSPSESSRVLASRNDATAATLLSRSGPNESSRARSNLAATSSKEEAGSSSDFGSSQAQQTPRQKASAPTSSTVLKKPAPPPLVALLADTQISKLIKQGAEAKVYISQLIDDSTLLWPTTSESSSYRSRRLPARVPVLLKWRFPKTYRHPVLSNNITASRTIMEARALLRCAKSGVAVPGVRCVDEKEGILGLELIDGKSVREWLGGGAEGDEDQEAETGDDQASQDDEEVLAHEDQVKLMQLIGRQLATMHEADIVHGDLTTSNMMLRSREAKHQGTTTVDLDKDEVVLIDFGLSSVSAFPEDKAVDLYVLERAFASTHPASEHLFQTVLDSYADLIVQRSSSRKGSKGKPNRWDEVKKRLEEVRLRGRKRSMVGFKDLVQAYRASRVTFGLELAITFEVRGLSTLLRSAGGHRLPRQDRGIPSKDRKRTEALGPGWSKVRDKLDVELREVGASHLIEEEPSARASLRHRHGDLGSSDGHLGNGGPASLDGEKDDSSFFFAIARRQVELWIPQQVRPLLPRRLLEEPAGSFARARDGLTFSFSQVSQTITIRGVSLVGSTVPRLVEWSLCSLVDGASRITDKLYDYSTQASSKTL